MSTQWINEWNREEEKKKERKWNALKYRLYDRLVTLVYSNELEFWKYIPPVSFHFLLPPLAFSPFITHVCVSVCQRYYTLLCVYYWAIVLLFCFGCSFCFVLFYFISFYSFFFVFVLVSSVFFQGGGMLVFCRTGGYHFWLYWVGLLLFPIHVRLNTSLTAMICLW